MERVNTLDRNKVISVFKNESLIEHDFSLPMIAESLWDGEGGALFYGTGLCNGDRLTVGVPFDLLAMVLVAEQLRLALKLSRVIHHIADTHALCNFPGDKLGVAAKAVEFQEVMEKTIAKFGLRHFSIVRASSFADSSDYSALMKQVGGPKDEEYAQRELADMLWYQKNHKVVVKLGWAAKNWRHDERWYDDKFVGRFGKTLSFIYTHPGRTFTEKKVPYIATTEEDRIFLRAGEQVQAKFDLAASKTRKDVMSGAMSYFAAICRLYERLVAPLDKGPVPQKVQQIINRIFE